MPPAPVSTASATLRQLIESHWMMWVFCRLCGHAERRDPREFARRVDQDIRLRDLARAFRCGRCGSKKAILFRSDHTNLVRTQERSR